VAQDIAVGTVADMTAGIAAAGVPDVAHLPGVSVLVLAGLAVGIAYGLFGVGSAVATPVLSLLGVTGMTAVVGPLPALLPGSAAGAWTYARGGKVDWRVARLTLVGAVPAAVAGAIASRWVGAPALLTLSGVVLLVAGLRVLGPGSAAAAGAAARRASTAFVVTAAVGVGFASGLLANGGGFLLVPLFLLVLGLDLNEAAGTSLLVAAALTAPTIVTHVALGNVDVGIAAAFAAGLVPGAMAGSQVAQRLPVARLRLAFGGFLVVFASWFLLRQLTG
jgi:uncharacterized membrane protein YfcA